MRKCALRHVHARGDFLGRQPLEDALEHLVLSCGQDRVALIPALLDVLGQELNHTLIHPDRAVGDQSNGLRQRARGIVFQENPRGAEPQRRRRFSGGHAGRHHQDFLRMAGATEGADELTPAILAEVEVQQHQIDPVSRQDLEGLAGRAAVGNHVKIRLRRQQATETFAKDDVIIDQQQPDSFHVRYARSHQPYVISRDPTRKEQTVDRKIGPGR